MNRWRWAILVVAVLTLIVAGIAWVGRPRLEVWIADRIVAALEGATPLPSKLEGVRVGLTPPSLTLDRLTLGDPGAPALDLYRASARLDVRAWSIDGRIARLAIDPAKWTAAPGEGVPLDLGSIAWLPSVKLSIGEIEAAGPVSISASDTDVEVRRPRPAITVALAVRELRLRHGEQTLSFAAPQLEVDVLGGGAALRSARVEGEAGSLLARPEGDSTRVDLHLDLGRLARFGDSTQALAGDLRWAGTVGFAAGGAGSLADVSLDGALTVDSLLAGDRRIDSVSARTRSDPAGRLVLDPIELRAADLEARGAVTLLRFEEPWPFDSSLVLTSIKPVSLVWPDAVDLTSGPASLQVAAQGELSPLSLEGSVQGTIPALQRLEAGKPKGDALDAALDLKLRRAADGFEARGRATLARQAPQAGRVASVDLDLRLAGDQGLGGVAKLEVADTRALQPLVPQIGTGRIGGDLSFAGSTAEPRVEGTFLGQDLVLSGIRFERLGGGFAADSSSFVARSIEMRALGGTARIDGRVALAAGVENDWRAVLDHVDLSAVWVALTAGGVGLPYTTGILNGSARATGSWEKGQLDATLSGQSIGIGAERLSSIAMRVAARQQKWTVDAEVVRRPDETITLAGTGAGLGSMWLSLWSTPWRVGGFRYFDDLPERGGEAFLRADLYGRLEAPLGGVQLSLVDLRVGERAIGTLTAEAHAFSGGRYELFVKDEEERLSVSGELRPETSRPFRLRAEVRDFDLAHVLAPQQPATLPAHGQAELSGSLDNPVGSLTGQLVLTHFAIGRDALRMEEVEPIVLRLRDGRVQVQSFGLEGDFGSLAVGGSAGLTGDIDLSLRLDADARVLEAIPGSTVRWASGSVALDARVRRSPGGDLDLGGHGGVTALSVDLGLPFLLTDANGGFELGGSKVTIESIRGRAGGGDFALGGHIDVAEGPRLTWAAEEVNSGFLDWLEDEVSGIGGIRGSWDELEIAGDVRVSSAIYDRDVALTDMLPIFRRQLGPTPPKPGEKAIRLDLRIRALDSIFIDNNIARAEFRADLHIAGTDLEPRIDGEVELLDGEATLFDRRFQVTKGKVDFDGRAKVNPTLEFSANTDVSTPDAEYNVVAQVTGTLDDPRVRLSADDSALTTTDVAMLLTVGKTTAQLQREGGGASAADFASLAPMLYGAQLQKGVQRYLPIDRFSLEPGFSRTTGDFEPRITVGTEIAPRLRGTLSTTMSAQTQNTVQLEYQLTPRVLVVGSWESRTETSAGGFGGALKFRYAFRYLPQYTLLPGEWWRRESP